MPLKPCRECAREVSSTASSCPHCGAQAPTDAADMAKGILALGTIMFAVIAIPILLLLGTCVLL